MSPSASTSASPAAPIPTAGSTWIADPAAGRARRVAGGAAAARPATALHHGGDLAQPLRRPRDRRPHDGPQAPPVPPPDRAARTGRRCRPSRSHSTSTPATPPISRRCADHGWRIVDPREVAATPSAFRDYVRGSGGRVLGRPGCLRGNGSGWFSDRTAAYLACGRPGARPGHRDRRGARAGPGAAARLRA